MQKKDNRTDSSFDALAAMESLFAASDRAMAILDRDLRFRFVNQRFADLQYRTIAALVGNTTRDVWPTWHSPIDAQLQQVIATSEPMLEMPVNYASPEDDNVRVSVLASFIPLRS
jgi:PAS domain-containing protein